MKLGELIGYDNKSVIDLSEDTKDLQVKLVISIEEKKQEKIKSLHKGVIF